MAISGSELSDRMESEAQASRGFRRGRLLLGGILFLALTVAIFGYQFHRIDAGDELPQVARLSWGHLFFILLLLPCETLIAAFRMRVICGVLQPGVSYRTCLKAELANTGMSILTPSQTGGGVGQMYVLNRAGVRAGTALTVSLLSFVGTMTALMGMGIYTLIAMGGDRIGPVFAAAALTLTVIAALVLLSAAWPGLFRVLISRTSRICWRARGRKYPLMEPHPPEDPSGNPAADRMGPLAARLVDVLYTYRDDLKRFLRKGKAAFLAACLLSAAFFLSRFLIAFLCVRFLGIEGSSVGQVVGIQMALVFVTYFGPTPGSAGIAEGASLAIMGGIVPVGYAPYYNLMWRFFTAYVAACAGLAVVFRALVREMREASRGRSGPEDRPGERDIPR
jgi:uncharacterized protein (TIRG00374 family)